MKRACLLLLPAMLLVALASSGCNEESKPLFTRIRVTPSCGVMPLDVEVFAAVSGGNETGDRLGGTNGLDVSWNFADGGTGNTSISYHRYTKAKTYDIIVTAVDSDGNTTSATVPVTVLPDSLEVTTSLIYRDREPTVGEPDRTPETGERIKFDIAALGCDVNYPAVLGDSVKMFYRWVITGAGVHDTFYGASPTYTFSSSGTYDVDLRVSYPAQAIMRNPKFSLQVIDPVVP